jgi:enamine deaminase RidA (YjgF/YER057c/UK114 family)
MAVKVAQGRAVKDIVDGGGLYFSRVATAGPFAFLAGVAADSSGAVTPEARVAAPYSASPPAHVVAQATYLFQRYSDALRELGSDINQMLQVEQFIPHKVYADGYLDVSRGAEFMTRGRPASALVCTGDLAPAGCVINPAGIAVIPSDGVSKEIPESSAGYHAGLAQPQFGETFAEEGPFNEVVTAGGYAFIVGDVAFDWTLGEIASEARASTTIWWGSEIRKEATFLLDRLGSYLGRVESSFEDVVHSTVYLTDIGDLFELDRIWRQYFPNDPPARTVVPVRGLSVPRWEGPNEGHRDNAIKMEHLTQAICRSSSLRKEVISTGSEQIEPCAEGVRAGNLLWISGQYAGGAAGLYCRPDSASQLEYLFERLARICEAGGTSLANLVRLRAFLTDAADAEIVYGLLRHAVPSDPPTVQVTTVPAPLPVPGACAVLDAVAHVPGSM